jgi:hypothetical protein
MYFVETKATSRLPYFGNLPLNTYLSVLCKAAVATELGGNKNLFISADLFQVKNVSCVLLLNLLIIDNASNTALKLQERIYKNTFPLFPPNSGVNLKTGQSVDDNILPWSLHSTLLLYALYCPAANLFKFKLDNLLLRGP